MGKRRARTGPGGAVVSSLSQKSGGTVKSGSDVGAASTSTAKPSKPRNHRNPVDQELEALANPASASSSSPGPSSSSSAWLGKSPSQMLREWCTKNNRKRPSFYPAGSDGIMKCVLHKGRNDGKKVKGTQFDIIVGHGDKPGEEYAALNVLHQIEHGKPIQRILAPEFRPVWLDLDKRYEQNQKEQAARAVRREKRELAAQRREDHRRNAQSATISISSTSRQIIEDALLLQKPSSAVSSSAGKSHMDSTVSHRISNKLVALGFSKLDAVHAGHMFYNVDAALDYLCLNLDESELPPSFAPKADVQVVNFVTPSNSVHPSTIDPHCRDLLSSVICMSHLTVERAMKRTGTDLSLALIDLYNSLTHNVIESHVNLSISSVDTGHLSSERATELETIAAIYDSDAKFGKDALSFANDCWAIAVNIQEGIPGLNFAHPVQVAFLDPCGTYPLSAPLVLIASSFGENASACDGLSSAQRRFLMRAAAGKLFSLHSPSYEGDSSEREPLPVVHTILSFLCDASEEELFSFASMRKPNSSPKVSSDEDEDAVSSTPDLPSSAKHVTHRPRRIMGPPSSHSVERMFSLRRKLPAYTARNDILNAIRLNQVVVISGATGSGKTTQVPQFILEDAVENDKPVSVICTQPRRIAAISVAERVASERGELVGNSVGFQVKLKSRKSRSTRLLFCTTGILLRRLQNDPLLDGPTHVIVDEVHERSIDTDFLLLLLREILPSRPQLKVILMSATLDATKFSSYFRRKTTVPVVSIPGRTFPVEQKYLADAVAYCGYRIGPGDRFSKKSKISDHVGKYGPEPPPDVDSRTEKNTASLASTADDPVADMGTDDEETIESSVPLVSLPPVDYRNGDVKQTVTLIDEEKVNVDLIDALVKRIDSDGRAKNDNGAILIFLPGVADISSTLQALSSGSEGRYLWVLPLHSLLTPEEQAKVFSHAPKGKRKVICATNIAETSITVEDVTIVIDTLRCKQSGFDALNSCSVLNEQYISKAEAKQRAGRAGRVSKGTCYRLIRETVFETRIVPQTKPEIQRVALDSLILNLLTIIPEEQLKGDVRKYLRKAVDPPSSDSVQTALTNLISIGALEKEDGGELYRVTSLGRHLSRFPVDPHIGKLLIFGSMFGCLDAALTIAATVSDRSPFVAPFKKRDEARAAKMAFAWGKSDLLTFVKAFNSWRDVRDGNEGFSAMKRFCSLHFMSLKTLMNIDNSRRQMADALVDAGFCKIYEERDWVRRDELNKFGSNARVLRAVICAALYPNVVRIDLPRTKYEEVVGGAIAKKYDAKDLQLRGKNKERLFLHPESVNFFEGDYFTRWLAYVSKVRTGKIFLRDSTMVSPYAILLFGGEIKVLHEKEQMCVDNWVIFKAQARVAVLAKELRKQLDDLLLQKFSNSELDIASEGEALTGAIVRLITLEA